MTLSARRSGLDPETLELLRDDPELIAIAELIRSLRPDFVDPDEAGTKFHPAFRLATVVRGFVAKTWRSMPR